MSIQQENHDLPDSSSPIERLENFMNKPSNRTCAECGSIDPKWASSNLGVFICIKCSGVHRSLGVHISKVLSVKLDEWTDLQVDHMVDCGGNATVNTKYEAFLPQNFKKPTPDSPNEERADFIRRKYELLEFSSPDKQRPPVAIPFQSSQNKAHNSKNFNKHHPAHRHGLTHAFSWRRREPEAQSVPDKTVGMVEFLGLMKVNILKGTNLVVCDMKSSDPYVSLSLGHQTMKTRVIKGNLNPIWNEEHILAIPDPIPPLKLQVYDKDTFTTDDRMGEAEIDIQPLVATARANEGSSSQSMKMSKWLASDDSTLVKSVISLVDGKVKQELTIRLQNVEHGELEIELECVPLSQ